ncbi:hypothetical protein SAMN02745127_01699 [Oceanospirillum multiglobuliferum]|nr:hypothetical protein SAMN02745127_01699 [Oceanospirillum multiglobuliferum]
MRLKSVFNTSDIYLCDRAVLWSMLKIKQGISLSLAGIFFPLYTYSWP